MEKLRKRYLIVVLPILILCALLSLSCGFIFNRMTASAQSVENLHNIEWNGAVKLTESTKYLPTRSYITELDKGFDASNVPENYALMKDGVGTPFVSFFIDTLGEGGSVYKGGSTYNGFDSYGFISGTGEPIYSHDEEKDEDILIGYQSVAIRLQYNYTSNDGLKGTDGKEWNVSEDTWKSSVNGIDGIGVIGKGAVIVQKFVPTETKNAPETQADWQRLNEFSGTETGGLHTVNFFKEYSPEKHSEPFIIYTPSGNDLQAGVFVKLSVVYELVHTDITRTWFGQKQTKSYKNVVEETVFYLCNTSGEVVFTNLYYGSDSSDESETNPEKNQTTAKEQKGGAISDYQGAIDGFRLDINGWNYNVTYRFNNSSNLMECNDGQVFLDPGKYEFTIKTKLGVVRKKTVYIHEKTEQSNIEVYFGGSLFSPNSIRVFSPMDTYPTYLEGSVILQTTNENLSFVQHAPLVGRIYRFDEQWDAVERDEMGLPKAELLVQKYSDEHNWSFSDLPAGNYEAVFANNVEYFEGDATGDTYRFVWRFSIVEEGILPSVNEELLYQQIGFSDFASSFYVAVLPSSGTGRVLVVFADESSAYNFASSFLASTARVLEGGYLFSGQLFSSESDMIAVLHEKAHEMVEKRYFDATDVLTYLTLEEDIIAPTPEMGSENIQSDYTSILNYELFHDILIFADEESRENLTIGEPFLNDRIMAYEDRNGEIVTTKKPVYFIQSADFETDSVTLHPVGTQLNFTVPFGVGVEGFLVSQGAPSGLYEITERNAIGENTYKAVYIRPGEITTSITIERLYNSNMTTHLLGKIQDGVRLRANSFRITDIANDFDPYGIIKISKDGEKSTVYSIDEAAALRTFDEEGNYTITVVDRLGNSATFFIDIYVSQKSYTISLMDNDTVIGTEAAYGGKNIKLPQLSAFDQKFEFYGWEDEDGNLYKDEFVFSKPRDVILKAVWHYASVRIDIIDGRTIAEYVSKVGVALNLPVLERDEFVLYGYRYTDEVGNVHIYRGQISYVPNVEEMQLTALWNRTEKQSIDVPPASGTALQLSLIDGTLAASLTLPTEGQVELPNLHSDNGMEFVGWLYEYRLAGIIFKQHISYDELLRVGITGNSIKLVAVWRAGETATHATVMGVGSTSNSVSDDLFPTVIGWIVGSVSLTLGFLALALITFRKRLSTFVNSIARFDKCEGYSIKKHRESAVTKANHGLCGTGNIRKKTIHKLKFDSLYRKAVFPCIIVMLCVTMLFTQQFQFVAGVKECIATAVTENKIETLIDRHKAEKQVQISSALNTISDYDELTLNKDEEFLYSNILIDLISMGYEDVFSAYAVVGINTKDSNDDRIVEGLGYTAYTDAYQDGEDYIFGAGFVSLANEDALKREEVESGVVIYVVEDEACDFEYTEFKLTVNQAYGPYHYVAYEKYVQYQVADYTIQYSINSDVGEYNDSLGDVYNYDIGDYCHYTNYGTEFDLAAYGISSDLDYNQILQLFKETMETQLQNSVTINVEQADFVSIQALNDYVVHNQDERFLGVDADELLYYEANISSNQYYIIYENGEVGVLELPPDPAKQATIWERIYMGLASVGTAILGVVVCSIPGVGPVLGGAMISAAIDVFTQTTISGTSPENINWVSVGTSAVIGAITGGIGAGTQSIAHGAIQTIENRVAKFFAGLGLEIASGLFSGAVTYLVGAGLRGEEISFKECLKSMALGAATGAVIFAGGQALSAIATKVNAKNVLNSLKTAGTILGGALAGMTSYILACTITGQEFSVQGILLALGMGAATATLVIIGGKIVKTVQAAQAKRLSNINKKSQYKNYQKLEDGVLKYYDDDGNLYRVGNDLEPDAEYTMNGYKYKTDSQGRVVSVEGDLYLNDGGRRPIKDSMAKIGKGSQQPTDQRGHLIGDRFNGGNGLENIVAQDGQLNQGEYKVLENYWADALKEGKSVSVEIKVVYTGDSQRPAIFVVEYKVDGASNNAIFENVSK